MIPGPLDTSDPADRLAMAEDVRTPAPMLDALSFDPDPRIRALVAAHFRTSEITRRRLAADSDKAVQRASLWSTVSDIS